MTRRGFMLALLALAALPVHSFAQQPGKVWRIGFLETTSMVTNAANLAAFLKGMEQLGHVEGRNFVIDYRSADGRAERFPDLAAELTRAKVDVIVARGTPAIQAAKRLTSTIPVVASAMGRPLLFVNSFARPGGNVTGLTSLTSDLTAKRLELMRELVPGVVSFGAITNMGNDTAALDVTEMEKAAKSLGVEIQHFDVRRGEDLPGAFEAATKRSLKAMLVYQDGLIQANSKQIVALAAKHRLPALYASSEYVADGGLMSFGVDYPDLYRRVATYVDKIIKGAKPGDLPIEQPTRFNLVINGKAAKALGIVVPRSLLIRADPVID